jgi:hypothetical protein
LQRLFVTLGVSGGLTGGVANAAHHRITTNHSEPVVRDH